MFNNTGEPFGLPQGTVRGIIALSFVGLIAYNFVTTGTIDAILLGTGAPYLGFYFADRQANTAAKRVEEAYREPVDEPYLGEDDV